MQSINHYEHKTPSGMVVLIIKRVGGSSYVLRRIGNILTVQRRQYSGLDVLYETVLSVFVTLPLACIIEIELPA